MAQRRMISKSISTSTKLADVTTFSKLLFTWLIPHCDDFGRMDGSARLVKAIVMPLFSETQEQVQVSLNELEKAGLIERYEVDGKTYLQIYKWDEHQTFKSDRPKQDIFPKNPSGNQKIPVGKNVRLSEDKGREGKLSEYKMLERAFDAFYELYPRKIARAKALQSWLKIHPGKHPAIMVAVKEQSQSDQWKEKDGKFIPHPATWLNQERWNDVLKVTRAGGKYEGVKTTQI